MIATLTWLLEFFPPIVWVVFLTTGILLNILGNFIPFYKLYFTILSYILIISSIWMFGALTNEQRWQDKIVEIKEKIEKSKQESIKENVMIKDRIIYKDKIYVEKGKTQIEYIDRVIKERDEVKLFVEKCTIPAIIINEHNNAATKENK